VPQAMWPFTKIQYVHRGAQTSIYSAVGEEISGHSGRYYNDCQEKDGRMVEGIVRKISWIVIILCF